MIGSVRREIRSAVLVMAMMRRLLLFKSLSACCFLTEIYKNMASLGLRTGNTTKKKVLMNIRHWFFSQQLVICFEHLQMRQI